MFIKYFVITATKFFPTRLIYLIGLVIMVLKGFPSTSYTSACKCFTFLVFYLVFSPGALAKDFIQVKSDGFLLDKSFNFLA